MERRDENWRCQIRIGMEMETKMRDGDKDRDGNRDRDEGWR